MTPDLLATEGGEGVALQPGVTPSVRFSMGPVRLTGQVTVGPKGVQSGGVNLELLKF